MSLHTCDMVIVPSVTLKRPHRRDNDRIESLVIPGKIKPFNGGVTNSCSTKKMKEKLINMFVRKKNRPTKLFYSLIFYLHHH